MAAQARGTRSARSLAVAGLAPAGPRLAAFADEVDTAIGDDERRDRRARRSRGRDAGHAGRRKEKAAGRSTARAVGNRYLVGLNSLITFPADPVMDTVKPREEFDELPLAAGTKYVAGFVTGIMLSMYRASMGAFDVIFAPAHADEDALSPEPRWMIFPGAHHDEF